MSEFTRYLPFILYACPFVVAAYVLVRAKLNEHADRRAAEAEAQPAETQDIMTRDDPMVEEVRLRPIYKAYVSYGL